MNDSRELSCVIKNYLRPAIVEASFRKGSWFLTKILPKIYVPRFTALRDYAISIGLSVFHH